MDRALMSYSLCVVSLFSASHPAVSMRQRTERLHTTMKEALANNTTTPSDGETTTGIAVGIVFGIIVFVLAILAVCCSVLCLLRKRKKCSPLVIAIPSDSEGARSPSNTPIADLSLPQDVVHEVQTFPALGATIHSSMGRGPVTAMDDHLASVNEDNPTTMTSSTAELLPTPLSMVHTLPHLVIQVKPKSTQL
ncbi:hypothetical protein EMCRGX_G025166 [Ephydatia muelleri]